MLYWRLSNLINLKRNNEGCERGGSGDVYKVECMCGKLASVIQWIKIRKANMINIGGEVDEKTIYEATIESYH